MRTIAARHFRVARLGALALAATVLSAAPAAAQDHSAGAVRPAAKLVATRAVATYHLRGARGDGLPAEVTVVDRGGQLEATYRLPGERVAQPMLVTVLDADLVLQAETDKGVLTIQLYGQNDSSSDGAVAGRWFLGKQSGELRGRVK